MDKKTRTRTRQMVYAWHDLKAESIRTTPALMMHYADKAAELAQPEHPPEIGAAGEVLPAETDNFIIRDRLQDPDTTAVDASLVRTDLLQRAGCLETGLDAAATIGARNSLEKMLAHQLAACHGAAMQLLAEVHERTPFNQNAEMIALKKITTSARLMDVFREGFTAIIKTRTAGGQRITVEHVTINGGQTVIAGSVTGGPHGAGGPNEK